MIKKNNKRLMKNSNQPGFPGLYDIALLYLSSEFDLSLTYLSFGFN